MFIELTDHYQKSLTLIAPSAILAVHRISSEGKDYTAIHIAPGENRSIIFVNETPEEVKEKIQQITS